MNAVYRGVVTQCLFFAGILDKDVTVSAPGLTKLVTENIT
jgi:hypothetical protein